MNGENDLYFRTAPLRPTFDPTKTDPNVYETKSLSDPKKSFKLAVYVLIFQPIMKVL